MLEKKVLNAVTTIDLGDALRYGDPLNVVASDDIFANDAQACPKKKENATQHSDADLLVVVI